MSNSANKSIKSFTCPINNCGDNIIEDPSKIADHLRQSHRGASMKMNLYNDHTSAAFMCHHCDRYLRRMHFHCVICENAHAETDTKVETFRSKKALDEHRATHPQRWYLERSCNHITETNGKHVITCRGWKSGACGFNHMQHEENFVMADAVPQWLCRYENLETGKRCLREKCSFEHLWGRVRFQIKKKESGGATTASSVAAPEAAAEVPDASTVAEVAVAETADKVVEAKENTGATEQVAPTTPERRPSGKCPGAPKKSWVRK